MELFQSWIDVLILLVVGAALGHAWQRGFLAVSLDLAGLIWSVWAALRWYQPVGAWLVAQLGVQTVLAPALAFFLLWIGAGLVVSLAGGLLMAQVPEAIHKSTLNRSLALVPGVINGLITAAVLVTLAVVLPTPLPIESAVRRAWLGNRLLTATTTVEANLRPVLDDALGELLTFRAIRPDSNERLDLPFTVSAPLSSPEAEAEMLRLLNQARAEAGEPPLAPDEALRGVARAYATDMFQRGYFAHVSPEGKDPFDRIEEAGISYRAAGENLALAPTVNVAHAGLMRSPGHRANILEPRYRRVGIGAVDGGLRGLMFVQLFRD